MNNLEYSTPDTKTSEVLKQEMDRRMAQGALAGYGTGSGRIADLTGMPVHETDIAFYYPDPTMNGKEL